MQKAIGDIKIGTIRDSIPGYVPVRCDRQTPLGNPFVMHGEKDRDRVCDMYDNCLGGYYSKNALVSNEINRIIGLVRNGRNVLLQCHCHPKRCHTESIRSFILNLIYPIKPE